MTHSDEITDIAQESEKYRADGPDIFPNLDRSMASEMRRIGVASAARMIAGDLWGYPVPTSSGRTLECAIMYYHRPSPCIPHETYQETLDFVASWVPGGRRANMNEIKQADRRRMMKSCIEAAEAHLARYRRRKAI